MKPLRDVFNQSKHSVFHLGKSAQIVNKAQEICDEWYQASSPCVRAISFNRGVLKVECVSSVIKADIAIRQKNLIDAIHQTIGESCISRIICVVNGSMMR